MKEANSKNKIANNKLMLISYKKILITAMETTLESPVAIAAKEMLERRKKNVKLGSQLPVAHPLPPKKNFKKLALSTILIIIMITLAATEFSKCTVTGAASNNKKLLPNAKLEFHNMNSNQIHYIQSSNEGNFKVGLPQGIYKVCSKDSGIQNYYKNPKTSPIRVKVTKSMSIKVGFVSRN